MIGYSVDRPVASKFSGCRVASVGYWVKFTVNIVYFNFKLANTLVIYLKFLFSQKHGVKICNIFV